MDVQESEPKIENGPWPPGNCEESPQLKGGAICLSTATGFKDTPPMCVRSFKKGTEHSELEDIYLPDNASSKAVKH